MHPKPRFRYVGRVAFLFQNMPQSQTENKMKLSIALRTRLRLLCYLLLAVEPTDTRIKHEIRSSVLEIKHPFLSAGHLLKRLFLHFNIALNF